ncbi:MAG: SMP-30/gluconolactonase/LRE family protein [Pseudomonadales bacterium]|nr:SMP-30/gluconolactonase/LRE family protein [Pseudomonadales bacterium]
MKLVKTIACLMVSFFAIAYTALAIRSSIDAVFWQPDLNPGLTGVYAPNMALSEADLVLQDYGYGPEDVTKGPDGWIYTGYEDGRVVRFDPRQPKQSVELFVNTEGRPLGLQFDRFKNLIVADAKKGLLSVSPSGQITILVDQLDGVPLLFVDDLDIADDGTIWFSDASRRFDYYSNIYNFLEARFTGRLLSYSPLTGQTKVHMDDLFFANGVALGPQDQYVLINETGMARIHRLWLKGEKRGERDIFIDQLPALPDNLSFNESDKFWVALVSLRDAQFESWANKIWLRNLLAGLPVSAFDSMTHSTFGFAIALDLEGNVVESLQTSAGSIYSITSVNQFDDDLYFGSLTMPALSRMKIR